MGTIPSNPHDAFFRHVFTRPADAASELRAVLPEKIVAAVNWNTLTVCKDSFVSPELRDRRSDVLFQARIDGHDGYIHVLVEHQSRVDDFMALRMLEYTINIWNHHLQTHQEAKRLPVVIPLVIYASRTNTRWNAALDIADLLDTGPVPDAFADCLPHFRYQVDDLTTTDPPTLLRRPLTPMIGIMFVLQKEAPGSTTLDEVLSLILTPLTAMFEGPHGINDLNAVLKYIIKMADTPFTRMKPIIDRLGPAAQEATMTTGDMLRAEGRAATLLDQLTTKFGGTSESVRRTVREATLPDLETWSRRILTADTIDAVFS
ncbi:Rpn family recombination-promoting nuclease/putative transposase [Nocardia jiangxiensis]|uniref:Rpn family recombination-promoting nuclease/putative transposase n=1 Tax=Nocardia jiangxiensis TaxID=282685 RepID=A0ABW6S3B6_9NOCA|nr:Rpn family recombination-promoting nuclease/putative transposase [Nocardia jiangxiensis]